MESQTSSELFAKQNHTPFFFPISTSSMQALF